MSDVRRKTILLRAAPLPPSAALPLKGGVNEPPKAAGGQHASRQFVHTLSDRACRRCRELLTRA